MLLVIDYNLFFIEIVNLKLKVGKCTFWKKCPILKVKLSCFVGDFLAKCPISKKCVLNQLNNFYIYYCIVRDMFM